MLTITTPERRQCLRTDVFIVNFELIYNIALMSLLLALKANLTHYFAISIIDFEQVNDG